MKKLLLITALLLASLTVSAQNSLNADKFCLEASKIAWHIMLARQKGATYEQAYNIVNDNYPKLAFLVNAAYDMPVVHGDGAKTSFAQEFAIDGYNQCIVAFSS